MTDLVLILGCAAIIALTILTATTIYVQAWERVQMRRTDNWVTVNRENVAANRAVIRDTLRNHHQEQP